MEKKFIYAFAKAQSLPRPERAVLRQCCHFCDARTLEFWATVSRLAVEVDYSERKVQYALRHLEAQGLIENTARKHRTRRNRLVPIYRLKLDRVMSGEAPAPERDTLLHPVGRTSVHPHKKDFENNISKEIDGRGGAVPAELRRAFVDFQGEDWTASYIDPCDWHPDLEALRPWRDIAGDRIMRDASRVLKAHGVTMLKSNGHAR